MSPTARAVAPTTAGRYDQALSYGRDRHLPPDAPRPRPTAGWPPENVALLERYREWLLSSGTSPDVTARIYLPMAGHALGLNLKPYPELDLDQDLERALDYVKAKQLSAEWTDMCRCGLDKFRHFLRQQRGITTVRFEPPDYARYREGLPAWLVSELARYQAVRQSHWRPARLNQQSTCFWQHQTRFWRWLGQRQTLTQLADVQRRHLCDYADHQLAHGYAASTINADLRGLRGFLLFLQDEAYPVPQALLRMPSLKQPDALPRFLTDEQVRLLQNDFEQQVLQTPHPSAHRDALLSRAAFYLMWQAGLRLGEVEELRLEDLDLPGRKLMVRRGKGLRDRTVYLTDTTVRALDAYLSVRGMGPASHVFLYRNEPIKKDLLHSRIQAAGDRVGVKVHPHRLRHTMATQLLNAGCRITSVQKLLGHKRLNSTMTYARVHDQTVADDYFTAMTRVERRLALGLQAAESAQAPGAAPEQAQLLALVDQLAIPTLEPTTRLALALQLRGLLTQAGTPAASADPSDAHPGHGHEPTTAPLTCSMPVL